MPVRKRVILLELIIDGFRQAVIDSDLADVPVEGYPFTWFKNLDTLLAVEGSDEVDRGKKEKMFNTLHPNI